MNQAFQRRFKYLLMAGVFFGVSLIAQSIQPIEPRAEFRLVHFNIKELSTDKIIKPNQEQLDASIRILKLLKPDLLSLNEIQFDRKDVATYGLPGGGKNMDRIVQRIEPRTFKAFSRWFTYLEEANTGKNAAKVSGEYLPAPTGSEVMARADLVNFGIFPGQYSTGIASRYKIVDRKVFSDIQWRDWDPKVDFSAYRLSKRNPKLEEGEPIPENIELFDKNFSDLTLKIKANKLSPAKRFHLIALHTVPAFNFGNKKGLNHIRNAAQLAFLEWYLFGKCDLESESKIKSCRGGVQPLGKNKPFIVVGDLNTDIRSDDPGAPVLDRIYNHPRVHRQFPVNSDPAFKSIPGEKYSEVTYLSDGWAEGNDLKSLQLQLDYFIVSKDFDIDRMKVFAPSSEYLEHGCFESEVAASTHLKGVEKQLSPTHIGLRSVREYRENLEDGTVVKKVDYCVIQVSREFYEFRKASDHLPIFADLRF